MSFFAKLRAGSDSSDSDSGSESEESILSGEEGEEQDRKLAQRQKAKASQFLRSDAEDSDEDDSDESDEDMSDDDSEDGRQAKANRFLKGAASSDEDSDEEDKTVVLSAKDKRFAEMEAAIQNIQNATKAANGAANDWVLASSELDKLLRFIGRHQTVMTASPIPPAGHIPTAFLQTLVSLEQSVNDTYAAEKNATKKMAPVKAKALNGMRQTLKKKLKEFEGVLTIYNADPAVYAAAYESANAVPSAPKAPRRARPTGDEEEGPSDFTTIGRGGRALNFTADSVFKTLKEIFEARGKKNTDRAETIRILGKLLEVSETTYQRIRVLLALVPARLDYSQALPSIPHDSWVSCRAELDQLISILLDNPDYVVQENVEEYDDQLERTPEVVNGKTKRVAVAGNVISLVENLDNEFTKTLQHTDAQEKGSEYIERLREEAPLYTTIVKAQALFERENLSDAVARVVMRRVEHIYAKPDVIIAHFEQVTAPAVANLHSEITPFGVERSPSALIHLLCVYIYSSDAPLLRARAILVHIFNHAMHGRFHQARDLLLMSHLQDTVQHADVTTQILYNRAVMQLGLAAFRNGFIPECQTILSEMFSTQRQKELLAQAIQRFGTQLSPEQELVEKRRLLPFHMHMNIELLEAAYLTSCMLIEIPLMANAETDDQRRRIASKTFKRLLDMADKQSFMGPPENTRDHVVKASKALQAGDWERARDLILDIKVWTLLDNVDEVKEMLTKKIRQEGLRTYLFTYSTYYASLSLEHLSTTFDLSTGAITSLISRMIYSDELPASLDQIDGVVIFHRVETTEVQRLAQQLAERAVQLVESNEKTLDAKLGNNEKTGGEGGRGGAEGGQGGRGGARGAGGERRGGARGSYRGRGGGRGRGGFNTGLGGSMGQRRVAA